MAYIPTSCFLKEALDRGFIYQSTNLTELDALCLQKNTSFYVGFDATAKSLHVGSLVPIMFARLAQKHGLRPIILMGGGTTKIGDPSGKTELRQLLTDEKIQENLESIKEIFSRYIHFGKDPGEALYVNNADWLESLNYIEFLRDYGRYFTINRMLTMEAVKGRLDREQPLTFIEFNYMIFQAYDFLHLFQKEKCFIQVGGADQWGNIIMGIDLIHKALGKQAYGITFPLLTTSSGTKMGKTAQGAVWLKEEQLAPFEYWQFWRNTEDADVERFLKLFTDLPLEEIKKICQKSGEGLNTAKKILADEATRLAHGAAAVDHARKTAEILFESPQDIAHIVVVGRDAAGIIQTQPSLPVVEISSQEALQGISIIDLLVKSGLAPSKGEARRLIQGKGARLNDVPIEAESLLILSKDFSDNNLIKLSSGKKRHILIYKQPK